ncbi:DUF3891 family protein [Siminovitchia fortis]|uniref:DUF3891 family protein n=1 Tax=Siminovitchia fortis TaxID=254758 RepID=UPI0011AA6FC3|nr:DUF3891 family protein [Siminovitchia fortis]
MIVRERPDEFVMIEQHHHAEISGKLMCCLKEELLKGQARESVTFAVYQHDCGWKLADKQPIWNDSELAPYSFTNFPTPLKTLIYQHGIDEVAKEDAYAALLCSEHYTRFLLHDESEEAKAFVKKEKARQEQLIETLPRFDPALFGFHYGLLQLFDNLSLFICLNEPGKNENPFFRNGIPLAPALGLNGKLNVRWINENTVQVEDFPLEKACTVTLKQKTVRKEDIIKKGLIKSCLEAPLEKFSITMTPHI